MWLVRAPRRHSRPATLILKVAVHIAANPLVLDSLEHVKAVATLWIAPLAVITRAVAAGADGRVKVEHCI